MLHRNIVSHWRGAYTKWSLWWIHMIYVTKCIFLMVASMGQKQLYVHDCPSYAPVTSHSRALYGLFPGCFEQESYVHSPAPYRSRAAPYEFCLPVRARRVLMHALKAYRPCKGLEIINSPWTTRAGPHGTRTATYDARAGFLQILVVSIPLRASPYGPVEF